MTSPHTQNRLKRCWTRSSSPRSCGISPAHPTPTRFSDSWIMWAGGLCAAQLSVTVFLDASESMTFGEPRKFDFARQVAAAVGYVALCGFDRVSVVTFPDMLQQSMTESELKTRSQELAARSALRSVRGRKSALQFFQNIN